jgi:hypothetical protein
MMFAVGQYDTDGNYMPYKEPFRVYRFGESYRDEDGFPIAVLDEYSDWVAPRMRALGLKVKIKLEADTTNPQGEPK